MTAFLAMSCNFDDKLQTLQEQLDEMKAAQEQMQQNQDAMGNQQNSSDQTDQAQNEKINEIIYTLFGEVKDNTQFDENKGEIGASYEGGFSEMYKFIGQNLNFVGTPGTEGKVYVKIIIDKTGSVGMTIIERRLEPEKDAEAVRVCKLLKFTPASINGKPVAASMMIAVRFIENN